MRDIEARYLNSLIAGFTESGIKEKKTLSVKKALNISLLISCYLNFSLCFSMIKTSVFVWLFALQPG